MTARSSFSSPSRSEAARAGAHRACVVAAALAVLSFPAGARSGTVRATVRVEQATFRADGPKHDRDVVVMLERVGGPAAPPATGRVSMDQRALVFIPHVLAIQKGTTVTFLNSDRDAHNVYFLDADTGRTLDIGTWGPGVSVDHRFDESGSVIVLCRLHLEMAAHVVVSASPWFQAAQLDPATRTTSLRIDGVPAGEYQVTVWHKKLRPLDLPARLAVPDAGSVEVPVVLTKASRAKAK